MVVKEEEGGETRLLGDEIELGGDELRRNGLGTVRTEHTDDVAISRQHQRHTCKPTLPTTPARPCMRAYLRAVCVRVCVWPVAGGQVWREWL